MTSFFRFNFTHEAVKLIHERTESGTFQIHIFDNGSDKETQKALLYLLENEKIASLHLDSRNTGCLYNKSIFHAMTESCNKYYVVTDNDVYPPALTPSWLVQMTEIMDRHPELAFLTPQFPPQGLSQPEQILNDVIYCRAVGNAFKIIRKSAFPSFNTSIGAYGDDGLVCNLARKNGFKSAFCRNIFCYHAGQCNNWGYKPEEIAKDPRKQGYGKPFRYELANELTYEPKPEWKM